MTLSADALEDMARDQTGLRDFGDGTHRDGLERLVDSMNEEAGLSESGEVMMLHRLVNLLTSRLQVEDTYRASPSIEEEVVEGPVFVIGLPRTGTTALSQLVAADPQFRSLRTWESSAPCPPPETATEHTDPRIAETEAGLAMMNEMFPLMQSMHHAEATTATECQDLLGMSFRTVHFDGFARVPSYLAWVTESDMRSTYLYHRRVLHLLQWHCPPRLWHLKTPVHMFSLDALVEAYPNAKFLWSHRDPTKVLGSVCSLIHYTRSWASDRDDAMELGAEQLGRWWLAVSRAMDFRARVGDERFADVAFADLQTDPIGALSAAYERIDLSFRDASRRAVTQWAGGHEPGAHGTHTYDLADFGLEAGQVRERFAPYLEAFEAAVTETPRGG
jgi:Sulfotransferase family